MSDLLDFYLDSHQIRITSESLYPLDIPFEAIYCRLGLTDNDIEKYRDCIQWYFPLTNPSSRIPNSPVLTKRDLELISVHPIYTKKQKLAYNRMINFFGFRRTLILGRVKCIKDWVKYGIPKPLLNSHNWYRITRILKSLVLFGNVKDANNLYNALIKASARYYKRTGIEYFPRETIKYWSDAITTSVSNNTYDQPERRPNII